MKKIFFSILCITLASCSSSDDVETDVMSGNIITARVNGNNFASSDELANATLTNSNLINILTVTGALARSSAGVTVSESIAVVVSFEDEADFAAGNSWTSGNEDSAERVLGQYIFAQGTLTGGDALIASSDDTNGDAFFRITDVDTNNQIFSGEFGFTAIDADTGDVYQITNGRINSLSYQIN